MTTRHSGLPFDDIRELIRTLPQGNEDIAMHTLAQLDIKKDAVADLCTWYSRWSGRSPVIHRPLLTLFAGTHVVEQQLSEGKSDKWLMDEVTGISQGSATINRLCHSADTGLKLFDLALQLPVSDIRVEPALDEKACAGTMAFGMEAIAGGTDLLCIGTIEKSPTVSALAMLCSLMGWEPGEFGSSDRDKEAVRVAIDRVNSPNIDALEVLRQLGGRETAAICGAILSARTQHIPVLVGGPSALAACAILFRIDTKSIGHCMLAQAFEDPALNSVSTELGLLPVFDKRVSSVAGGGGAIAAGFLQMTFKHFPVDRG